MKPSSIFYSSVLVPSIALALWRIDVSVAIAGLGAIGYACSSGAFPACVTAVVGSIIITAISAVNNGQNSGTTGSSTARRGLATVSHYLPNGTVHDYLNTAALEVGVWHHVKTGEHTLRASKHADGYNIIHASLSENGVGHLLKRVDGNAIEDISAQFGDRNWPVANQWSQDEIDNMSHLVIETEDLNAESMCSTISDDTDADTLDMSWIFETANYPYTEIPPPCSG